MKAVCVWLTDRLDQQLHVYQLKTLIKIVKVKKEYSLKFLLETLLMLIDHDTSAVSGQSRCTRSQKIKSICP